MVDFHLRGTGYMKYAIYALVAAAAFGYFFFTDEKPKTDLSQVLNRSVIAMERYDQYLKDNNVQKATDEHLKQLNGFMQKVMNADPRFHSGMIATSLGSDAKITGVDDANGNGQAEADEKKLFTVEIDSANNRLIATDESGAGTYRGFSGTGFLAGALIGAMLSRQRSAGVQPGSFNNRKLASPTTYSQARSRARSGGLRGGK